MSSDALIVFLTLGVTIALFVSDRLRLDVVALLSLLALSVSGVLTPEEGLSGFSNPIVVMIAGLFVVGGALTHTGVADWLGERLGSVAGSHEARLIAVIMLATALLSAFMSSTGTVAVLLPVVINMARRARVSPSRLLIPLAFASLLGGMLTLIGTPPNIVVTGELRAQGLTPFRFFSFTPAGLVMLALGTGFMVLVGRHLLPRGSGRADSVPPSADLMRDMASDYDLVSHLHRLRVEPDSALIGRSLGQADLRARFATTVVGIRHAERPQRGAERVLPTTVFAAGDVLLVQAEPEQVERAAAELGLSRLPGLTDLALPGDESLAEIVVPRRSRLVGQSLRTLRFRDRYRATVLAVRKAGQTSSERGDLPATRDLRLDSGDTLLIKGRIDLLRLLRDERRDFVMVTEPRAPEAAKIDGARATLALVITLAMLMLMTFGVVSNVVAVLLSAVAMVLVGALPAHEAYRGINWESVVLIAAILPMATALEKTGGMKLVVDGLVTSLGAAGPRVMLAVLFVLTSVFSQVISNTATTVLVAPIAFRIATDLGVLPQAFLMTVAIAASTAFATPIASPVNTLVLNAGGYKFADFFKVGVILQLLLLAATMLVVPWLFPLR